MTFSPAHSKDESDGSASLWEDLLGLALDGSELHDSCLHGQTHWRAVAAMGLALCDLLPSASRPHALAFGMLHDCKRISEDWDPEHGARAASLIEDNDRLLSELLPGHARRSLAYSCLWHEKGLVSRDILDVGLAWDSDRYNLRRLDIDIRRDLLSAPVSEAQFEALIDTVESYWRNPPEWEELIVWVSTPACGRPAESSWALL